MKTEHTPTLGHDPLPWKTGRSRADVIVSVNGSCVADCSHYPGDPQAQANAAHIVRAVNSHEALLGAAKVGLALALTSPKCVQGFATAEIDQMREAIAQAETQA